MNRTAAIHEAKKLHNVNNPMTVYRDPIGMGEQEGHHNPWAYCPTEALGLAARFREKEHDFPLAMLDNAVDTVSKHEHFNGSENLAVIIQGKPRHPEILFATYWEAQLFLEEQDKLKDFNPEEHFESPDAAAAYAHQFPEPYERFKEILLINLDWGEFGFSKELIDSFECHPA